MKRQGAVLDIVINDPHDLEKGLDIRRAFPGATVRFSVGLRRDIEQYLLVATGQANGRHRSPRSLVNWSMKLVSSETVMPSPSEIDENDSAIVRLTNQIIAEAYRLGASDVHVRTLFGSQRNSRAVPC